MLKWITERLIRGRFARDALTVVVGTSLAQIISIVVSPITTRLYNPAQFGVFALYLSFVTILSTIATGRYDVAVLLARDDREADGVALGATIICAIASVVLLVGAIFFGPRIASGLGAPSLAPWLLLAPVAILFTGVSTTFSYWHNRHSHYRKIATSRVVQAACASTASIGLGAVWPAGGLAWSQLLGQVVFTAQLGPKRGAARLRTRGLSRASVTAALAHFKRFPLVSIPSDMINLLSGQLPRFVLSSFFGGDILGRFFLTQRVLDLPLGVLAGSVRDVFNQRASEAYRSGDGCRSLFLKTFKHLVLLAVAPSAFAFVFGETWRDAGVYVRILMPLYFLRFCVSPLCMMFYIARKQHQELVWQIALLVLSCGAFAVGIVDNNAKLGLLAYSLCYSGMYVVIFFMALRLTVDRHHAGHNGSAALASGDPLRLGGER
jgi:O-antigen/teichoic acid export membrane protein